MRFVFVGILAIALSGCAITWTTVAASIASAAVIAEDVGGILETYKETRDSLLDTNTTEG